MLIQPMFKKHKFFYRDLSSCIIYFSALFILLLCITFFYRKASSNMYHYCAIFVQSLSAYTRTDR